MGYLLSGFYIMCLGGLVGYKTSQFNGTRSGNIIKVLIHNVSPFLIRDTSPVVAPVVAYFISIAATMW